MNESSEGGRIALVRSSLMFQVKLIADGFRDFLLVPVSLAATIIGLLRSGEDPEREFEQVLDLGRKTERWINLFGTHEPVPEAGQAGNLDQLVARAESLLREQARQGDVSENAAKALEKALDALHRRARETPAAGPGGRAAPDGESGPPSDHQ